MSASDQESAAVSGEPHTNHSFVSTTIHFLMIFLLVALQNQAQRQRKRDLLQETEEEEEEEGESEREGKGKVWLYIEFAATPNDAHSG